MKKITVILFLCLISICSCYAQRSIEKHETYRRLPIGHESLLNADKYNKQQYLSENFDKYYRDLLQILPSFSIEYVKIGDSDDRYCCCEDNNVLMGTFNYRLPDIHGLQVYYVTNPVCNSRYLGMSSEICGNLILVDTVLQHAKLINVFLEGYGDQHIDYRYYTIDENYNITIFPAAVYDDGFSLWKKYLINITPDKEINIFECNCLNQGNIYDHFSSSDEIPDVWIKKDSCQYYQELYYNNLLKRRFPYPASNYITPAEVQLIVEDSVAYWSKYVETGNLRALNDSIKYLKKIERLQNVIHPVDSILPFGPKSLEYLIRTNQNQIGFFTLSNQYLTTQELISRKLIYETWMYYLAFHPSEFPVSEERILLNLKTYKYLNFSNEEDKDIEDDNFKEDINIGHIAVKISNIQGFEVYYSTTGVESYDNGCGIQGNKTEEDFYFSDRYNWCDSKGYLIFYDRKRQHGTIIPVYEYGYRFFYISKDNTIHIFEGDRRDVTITLSKSYEIKIGKDKKFTVNQNIVQND